MSLMQNLARPLVARATGQQLSKHDTSMVRSSEKQRPSTIKIDRRRAADRSPCYDKFDRDAVDHDSFPAPSPRSGEGGASPGGVPFLDPRTIPHPAQLSGYELSIIASANVAASAKPNTRVVEIPLPRLMREAHVIDMQLVLTALSILQDRRIISYAVVTTAGAVKVLISSWSDTSHLMRRLGDLIAPHVRAESGLESVRNTGSEIDVASLACPSISLSDSD